MTHPFASTLSTRGFLALGNAGFRPLRQVQGTSIVSLGWQRKPSRWMRGALSPMMLQGTPAAGGGGAMRVYYPRGSLTVQASAAFVAAAACSRKRASSARLSGASWMRHQLDTTPRT